MSVTEQDADPRKYVAGTTLTFRSYDHDEVQHLGEYHEYVFRRGDRLIVLGAPDMGITVKRISDGRVDMVWPTEVCVSRRQEGGGV